MSATTYFGTYRGICVTNADPENLMRIKVQVPQLLGTEATDWAWPCIPPGWPAPLLAHADAHTHEHVLRQATPAPGEGVWVSFEAGDITKPIWMGIWKRKA